MNNENREVLLKVEHLEQFFKLGKRYNRAVNDVNFEVYKGEVFGLVGESGCGKTTTGRSIIKLYDITSGSVYFKGQRIAAGIRSYQIAIKNAKAKAKEEIQRLTAQLSEGANPEEINSKIQLVKEELAQVIAYNKEEIAKAKHDHFKCEHDYSKRLLAELEEEFAPKFEAAANNPEELAKVKKEYASRRKIAKSPHLVTQIQMIFQDPIASLNPRMTVEEIISEGLVIRGITDKEYIKEQVYNILETVGLVREHATRYPHEFSGGQRQRIGIARSVIMNPEMIIADEPISALDVSIQAQVINLLRDLRDKLGLTVLFIAHDLSVVKYFSDRIGVMYYGKLVELADADELFAHPMHPYTKSLLSAIPLPDPNYEKQRIRIKYNALAAHDYSVDKPTLREIVPGHYVSCNDEEERRYREEYNSAE